MIRKLMSILSVGLLAFALTGCTTGNQVVRGQCPPGGGYGPACGPTCPPAACQQRGGCGGGMCGSGACGQGLNLPFHPVHRNYVDYQVPKNLSYPQPNTPAATVQYPYYTTKGPTDFFMK